MLHELESDLERAQLMQNMLVDRATGGSGSDSDYGQLRSYFMKNSRLKNLLPGFVRTSRSLAQFWGLIKAQFETYAERRDFIYDGFRPLLDYLEQGDLSPSDVAISDGLKSFNEEGVHAVWARALDRRTTDPEGAITSARTLLETVCKHILDELDVKYDAGKVELHDLYKLTSRELNLSPSQHTEDVFKQILGGCSAIVNGLGTLRNRIGDAHGQGKNPVRPKPRHAELAVNLAGALCLFLVATYNSTK